MRSCGRLLLAAAFCWLLLGAERGRADTPGESGRIERLLRQLDADRFLDRQDAQRQLLELGDAALPQLLLVPPGVSRERELRQKAIALAIQRRFLNEGFSQLAAERDERIDLDRAMWLVARIVDPTIAWEPLDRQLSSLADQVQARLGAGADASRVEPERVVAAMRQVLFVDFGLAGAQATYDHPHSSSLKHVLQSRRGLPILLSHVMISVGERLGVPLVGLQVPGRYMVKYDGSRAPEGVPRRDLIIDPFGGGQVLSPDELQRLLPGISPERLAASPRRDSVVRMLRNLAADYLQMGDEDQANEVLRYQRIMESGPADQP
ncbi:MAG: transglutaminase family protein [Pirellulaceae bacterium]|nr:transglutaminase family protein [Pirellulaceae bacterium]